MSFHIRGIHIHQRYLDYSTMKRWAALRRNPVSRIFNPSWSQWWDVPRITARGRLRLVMRSAVEHQAEAFQEEHEARLRWHRLALVRGREIERLRKALDAANAAELMKDKDHKKEVAELRLALANCEIALTITRYEDPEGT